MSGQHLHLEGHAFAEVDGQPVWPERDQYDEARRLANVKDHGEVAVVFYFQDRSGTWRPGTIITRERIQSGPHAGQWYASEFDADYSETSGTLYVHNSGGGGAPRAEIPKFTHAKDLPCRIWIADDIQPTIGKRRATAKMMHARGVVRVVCPPPAPFADTIEGDTFWCEACDDHLNRDDAQHCSLCREELHIHAGRTVLVATGEETLDEDGESETGEHGLVPGCYLIKKFPYYADGMIEGHLITHALERLGGVPVDIDTDGYPVGHLCDACSAKVVANRSVSAPEPDPEFDEMDEDPRHAD